MKNLAQFQQHDHPLKTSAEADRVAHLRRRVIDWSRRLEPYLNHKELVRLRHLADFKGPWPASESERLLKLIDLLAAAIQRHINVFASCAQPLDQSTCTNVASVLAPIGEAMGVVNALLASPGHERPPEPSL